MIRVADVSTISSLCFVPVVGKTAGYSHFPGIPFDSNKGFESQAPHPPSAPAAGKPLEGTASRKEAQQAAAAEKDRLQKIPPEARYATERPTRAICSAASSLTRVLEVLDVSSFVKLLNILPLSSFF